MVFCEDRKILDYLEIIPEYRGKGYASELITRLISYDHIEKVYTLPDMVKFWEKFFDEDDVIIENN